MPLNLASTLLRLSNIEVGIFSPWIFASGPICRLPPKIIRCGGFTSSNTARNDFFEVKQSSASSRTCHARFGQHLSAFLSNLFRATNAARASERITHARGLSFKPRSNCSAQPFRELSRISIRISKPGTLCDNADATALASG